METENILMGQRQLQRWHLIKMVEGRKMTLREAGEKMGVSYRQAKRIRRAIRERGIKGLVHGNRGQPFLPSGSDQANLLIFKQICPNNTCFLGLNLHFLPQKGPRKECLALVIQNFR